MKKNEKRKSRGLFTGKADYDHLAFLDPNAYSGGTSSYDRDGGNNDGFFGYNFIRRDENGDCVMCDLKGCGTITRIWLTGSYDNAKNMIKFYVDGEEPVYSISLSLLNDESADVSSAFPYPLVKRWYQCACGTVLLTPVRFLKSCKITITGVTAKTDGSTNLFYHVDYKLFGDKASFRPFAGRPADPELFSTVKNILPERLGKDPKPSKGISLSRKRVRVYANRLAVAFEAEGKAQIQRIILTLKNFNCAEKGDYESDHLRDRLNGLKIQIYWDGEQEPSVNAPIGSFFGLGTLGYKSETRSLYFGACGKKLYNYFPMPFEKSAKICFLSDHDEEFGLEIGSKNVDYDFADIGYFRTEFREFSLPAADPFEAVFLDMQGRGKVVAIQENIFGEEGADCRFEEGDNRIYIDGSRVPDIIGTGTEDYYNGAGYFLDNEGNSKLGLYSSDFTGYTAYRREGEGPCCRESISAYRILIHDAYEFRRSIRICFEHGGGERWLAGEKTMNTNQTAGYQTLVSYYFRPQPNQLISDSFSVSDTSAISHAYRAVGEKQTEQRKGAFFGGEDLIVRPYTAIFHKGKSSFTMSLPPENRGAVLRRISDCAEGEQNARVYIDGKYAGNWYSPQTNKKYPLFDPFFVIPSSLTVGKEKIRIRIENESLFPWAEVSYQICPLADGPQEDFLSDDVYALLLKNGSVVVCDGRLIVDSDRKNAHPFRLFTCGEKKYIVCGKSGKLVCATESGIKLCNYAGELPEGSCWTLERCGQGWDLRAENGKYLTFEIGSAAFKEEGSLNFIPFGKRVDCDY